MPRNVVVKWAERVSFYILMSISVLFLVIVIEYSLTHTLYSSEEFRVLKLINMILSYLDYPLVLLFCLQLLKANLKVQTLVTKESINIRLILQFSLLIVLTTAFIGNPGIKPFFKFDYFLYADFDDKVKTLSGFTTVFLLAFKEEVARLSLFLLYRSFGRWSAMLSALVFMAGHLSRFETADGLYLLLNYLVLFAIGVVYLKLDLRYGLLIGTLIHTANNSLIIIASLIGDQRSNIYLIGISEMLLAAIIFLLLWVRSSINGTLATPLTTE